MKKLKFRQKLFLYYSAIVFLVILLGFGAVYAYIVKRLQTEILQNMELSVKEMTGLDVVAVNVHVQGVQTPQEKISKVEEKPESQLEE